MRAVEDRLSNPTELELKALRIDDYLAYARGRDLAFPDNSQLVVDFMFLYAGNIVKELSTYTAVEEYKKQFSPQNGFDSVYEIRDTPPGKLFNQLGDANDIQSLPFRQAIANTLAERAPKYGDEAFPQGNEHLPDEARCLYHNLCEKDKDLIKGIYRYFTTGKRWPNDDRANFVLNSNNEFGNEKIWTTLSRRYVKEAPEDSNFRILAGFHGFDAKRLQGAVLMHTELPTLLQRDARTFIDHMDLEDFKDSCSIKGLSPDDENVLFKSMVYSHAAVVTSLSITHDAKFDCSMFYTLGHGPHAVSEHIAQLKEQHANRYGQKHHLDSPYTRFLADTYMIEESFKQFSPVVSEHFDRAALQLFDYRNLYHDELQDKQGYFAAAYESIRRELDIARGSENGRPVVDISPEKLNAFLHGKCTRSVDNLGRSVNDLRSQYEALTEGSSLSEIDATLKSCASYLKTLVNSHKTGVDLSEHCDRLRDLTTHINKVENDLNRNYRMNSGIGLGSENSITAGMKEVLSNYQSQSADNRRDFRPG